MGNTEKYQEYLIAPSQVPDPLKCLKCSGMDLTVEGRFERCYRQTLRAGQVDQDNTEIDSSLSQVIDAFLCEPCQTTFFVMDQQKIDLERQVLELQTQLAALAGRLVIPPGAKLTH